MSIIIDFQNRDGLVNEALSDVTALSWFQPVRDEALEAFQQAPLPTRKIEHWKYNDMSFLRNAAMNLCSQPSPETIENLSHKNKTISFETAIELLVIDGHLVTNIDSLTLESGLSITRFTELDEKQQATVLETFSTDKLNLLNNLQQVVMQQGIFIEAGKGQQIKTPVYIRYLNSAPTSASISSFTTLIASGVSAEITVVEEFDSQETTTELLALQHSKLLLAANSKLNHYRLNLEQETARQSSQVTSHLAQDSNLNSFYLGLGSRLNRTDINVLHQGHNAHADLTGIYLPSNQKAIDYHSNIEHQVAHCTTNEVFRGIVADQASATFNGKIHIFQDAQKSDAYLNNKNLLLTNQAEVNTKPELEIYADDVKCAHGATVAQLDNSSVYYLQTRGINKLQARKMLSIAFIQQLLNNIGLTEVQNYLNILLDEHMAKIAE